MRRSHLKIFFIGLLGYWFIGLFSPVSADYNTAYQDYTHQIDQYKNAYNSFQIAKSSYKTYGTLTSQNEAIIKFKFVLKSRDQVESTFYNLLQEKLNSTEGISSEDKNTFAGVKESEQKWLTEHQKKIDDASTLEDLNSVSVEFETRFPQMDLETKRAIGNVLLTKERILKSLVDNQLANLTSKIEEIRKSGEDTTILDRAIIAANNKLDFYNQKYSVAQKVFEGTPKNYNSDIVVVDVFAGQQKLAESNQYLRETLTILKEAVRSITGEI